ncbi:MAG TPA: rhomboid family intramembrane serine protease [Candidatus Polarisedimenticolaceae bacterium]|nr:rhomboid family intramembrane serine protease [Candidatus Polarisedimenticolaceae bacterium]
MLDQLVELLARAFDALGLNGTRLRWKWNRRRRELGESGLKAEMVVRSTQVAYKMCPSCRALVPRHVRRCTECGATLADVRAPGITRVIENLIPGATATTAAILLANTLMFALCLLRPFTADGYDPGPPFTRLLRFDLPTLVLYGSGLSPLTTQFHEWWRIITPVFLHGGLLHFLFNSLALVRLGPLVEEEFGTERLATIYVVTGIAGSAMSQLVRPVQTVGASGALCGLLGLLLVHGWRLGGAYGSRLKSVMLQNTVLMVGMSFLPGIDWLNHLGGFLAGCALALIVPSGSFRSRATEGVWIILAWLSIAAVLASFYFMSKLGVRDVGLLPPRFFH